MVCLVCFNAKQLDKGDLLADAELSGTLELREWIGDEAATASATGPARQRDALPGPRRPRMTAPGGVSGRAGPSQ